MSLLMNALKKAETAKQAGQSAEPDSVSTASITTRDLTQELGLDPQRGTSAEAASSVTRPGPLLRPMELALEPDTLPQAALAAPQTRESMIGTQGNAPRGAVGGRSKEAAGARALFAAKQPKPRNPQLPFYSVVGVCLLTAAGYGAYLWWQMQPPRPMMVASSAAAPKAAVAQPSPANTNSNTNSSSAAAAGAGVPVQTPVNADTPSMQPASGASGASAGGSSSGDSGLRAEPASAAATRTRSQDAPAPSNAERRFAAPRDARSGDGTQAGPERSGALQVRDTASAAGGVPVDSPANLRIARNATSAVVNPDVLTGYAALQAGDLDRAGQDYDRALRADPSNRDALLGAATVLLRLGRTDAAEAYFRQTLRLHPGDPYAAAQLASLTAQGDPVGALSQVNSLIAREAERPESGGGNGALAFVQGNQLSSQGRWPEAQQAYFNAHRADPGNADYCYNLAISLDRMREPRLARDFYSKALELSRLRPASFDAARARTRLAQLEASLK